MRIEALSRVTGEAELIKRHGPEFDRLLKRADGDRVQAVAGLVTKHAKEYGQLVTAARDRLRAGAQAVA
jgi:hypothetical protein